ncbi:MAG: type II secretion system secretin GspD [Gammaproteobacteria bacterium]|nr:type II secretion system secretin GspD [Gammaproteobacteria bacterium]
MAKNYIHATRLLTFCCTLLASVAMAQGTGGEQQVLNYRDADLGAVLEDIALFTGRTFVLDPGVRGKVTIVSDEPVAVADIFPILQATLDVNGYTAVAMANGAYKIVSKDSIKSAAAVSGGNDDAFRTEVITIHYVDYQTVQRMLAPLVSASGELIGNRGSNQVIVVDTRENIARIRELIARLDRDTTSVETISLKNTSAEEMARTLEALVARPGQEQGTVAAFSVIPVPGNNALLIRGDRAVLDRYLPIIRQLDAANANQGDIRVVYLNHSDAEVLAPVLQQVANQLVDQQAPGGGTTSTPGRGRVSIGVHSETNGLIISADREMQQVLERVIAQLDIRRPQVLIEAIIVEMSDTAARELGMQYVLGGGKHNIPFMANSYSRNAPNILALTGAARLNREFGEDSDQVNLARTVAVNSLLGLNGLAAGFAGVTSDNMLFGFILNALDQDQNSNVLSTPSVMTLDNATAKIIVGQEIPITVGETLGASNENPFRTVNRQDVGIALDVRPQINEGESIKLYIRQEVSGIVGPILENSTDLITSKREIETTVLADDGEIIVLGGLIEDSTQQTADKVPVLGDIPGLGKLFRTDGKSRSRTNLMVFLRPTIVRDVNDLRRVTQHKYDYITAEQRNRGEGDRLDGFIGNVMSPPVGEAP